MIRKILMLSVLIFTATLGALGQKVEMDLPSATVKQAIGELHRQGYSLVYQAGDLDTSKRIKVKANTLRKAVSQILAGQDVTYEISG